MLIATAIAFSILTSGASWGGAMVNEPNTADALKKRTQERFDILCQRIAKDFADTPVEEGLAEIDAIVMQGRHGSARS
jgi:hypothetical protein